VDRGLVLCRSSLECDGGSMQHVGLPFYFRKGEMGNGGRSIVGCYIFLPVG
jgi:hypothetical protein